MGVTRMYAVLLKELKHINTNYICDKYEVMWEYWLIAYYSIYVAY